jgi:hypothetical protein
MDTTLIKRYRFFREHAGYVVGRSAEGALDLARAERLLSDAIDADVARVQWRYDDLPYEHGFLSDEEIAAKFESNEWTGPFGCVIWIGDDLSDFDADSDRDPASWTQNTSLWGIVVGPRGTGDPYCRVVEAELASELADDLRQALGDARDAELPACI